MFGQMMASVDDDYVKYVMHSQVQVMDRPALEPGFGPCAVHRPGGPGARVAGHRRRPGGRPGARAKKSSSPPRSTGAMRQRWRRLPSARRAPAAMPPLPEAAPARGSLGSEFDRAGRNDPCPCGSGKKFKFCHGR